ncbi:MAG TPA: adenylosuccinate synthase [Chloroflexi bacterium]|nr:adenylosuccinate synthase [Chloroflexota bacterium]HAL27890.1 adenylosuccinate synthase [Chloroflexota bacterium]
MPVTAIVGAQWGDEGKGKITDLLAQEADLVIRYQGGNNAGHTVVNEFGTFKLHLVPSGIFNPNATCVLGTGMVIDLATLRDEIRMLEGRGVSTANLRISERAHLLMPWHTALDRLDERERGRRKLGTTGQGVGPAYADKVARHGIQLYEVRDESGFRARVAHELETKNVILTKFGDAPLDARTVADGVLEAAAVLGDRIVDTLPIVEHAVATDARVLLEGQLGAMRDLDWGIYPYVTSSNPLAGFASIGAGIPARSITRVVGVVKAYSTAVGEGPFPTELAGEEANALRERAEEYGATTGRPRRIGWFDAVAARHAQRLNAFTELAVTKLDMLGSYEEIPFCTAYSLDGRLTSDMPPTKLLDRATPHYERLRGWCQDIGAIREQAQLPAPARAYLKRIEETVGAPIGMVGVGPERNATLLS